MRHPRIFIAFTVTISCLFLTIYLVEQQQLRNSANDPQIQMAREAVEAIEAGAPLDSFLLSKREELSTSLSPFTQIYDKSGGAVVSQVILGADIPEIPAGVLDYSLAHGEYHVTWQPQPGVRIASVVMPFDPQGGGYVVVGRSLYLSEQRTYELSKEIALAWVVTLLLILWVFYATSFANPKHSPQEGARDGSR